MGFKLDGLEVLFRCEGVEIQRETDTDLLGWCRDFLNMFSKLDSKALEEAIRRDPEMARTWRDIFKVDEEINTAVSTAINDSTRMNLFTYVQDGAMAIDYAAKQANLSTDQFRAEMADRGFRVPQGA